MSTRARRMTAAEQYELIMECRRSGLTDAQWCLEHDVNPGTFYNWVTRLRKKNYDLPSAAGKSTKPTDAPDIVRMEIIPDSPAIPLEVPTCNNVINMSPQSAPVEISFGDTVIRITNDVDPRLFAQILRQIGGALC